MSQAINLGATLRQGVLADKKDFIPAVIYGSGIENMSLNLARPEFEKVFSKSGESGLISLKIDNGQEYPVIVKDFQIDAIKQTIIHVDFFKVNMDEKVVAEVAIEYIGESPAVKTFGGIVVHNFDTLEIECLPSDLIQHVDVDLSSLANIGDAITLGDIKLPQGVVFTHSLEDMVVRVVESKKTVEDAAADAVIEATAAANAAGTADTSAKPAAKSEEKK
jgi:large subunit ribosomal protein L25